MRNLIGTLLIGLTLGSVYSLMALALVLVWRSTRVVNFAQAGQAIVTTYIAYEIVTRTGVFWLAILFAIAAGALLGAGVEYFLMRTLFRHVNEGPVAALAPVIATLGLLGVIRSFVGMIWGNDFRTFYSPVSTDNFVFAGDTIPFSRLNLLIILATVAVMIIFSIIFQRTDLGLSLRAAAFQPEIARLACIWFCRGSYRRIRKFARRCWRWIGIRSWSFNCFELRWNFTRIPINICRLDYFVNCETKWNFGSEEGAQCIGSRLKRRY